MTTATKKTSVSKISSSASQNCPSNNPQQRSIPIIADLSTAKTGDQLCLKIYHPETPIVLSDIMPLIENMGLKIDYTQKPQETTDKQGRKVFLHEFFGAPSVETNGKDIKLIKNLFENMLTKVWNGEVENDAFNSLTMQIGIDWREVILLRALARYLRQLRTPYSHEAMAAALVKSPAIAQKFIALFHTRLDPSFPGNRDKTSATLAAEILEAISSIQVVEEDRTLRRYLNLIQSMLRTNYYQKTADGSFKPYLSIKFDSRKVDYMPLPKPLVEIYVYSARLEAVHLRGGKVARGGIRWSDRREDFRHEILGLMKAQMVKNSVIVPVGSKGGFIVKHPPADAEAFYAEGVECYRTMMRGLLDLTDNRVNGKIIPPKNVVRHDEDDPYLVVAADKGTAKFSDIANSISQEYGFWLDDAFASGGSAGYDHKQMGITARGAWEAVKRHFREIGKDIQSEDFTCVGVGDMSGDVFGNGMLLSQHIRLIAAFDHRHIFIDPNPVAATSFEERKRLFDLPRSSWADYNAKKISKGGGVFARSEKIIKLSPEAKKAFGLTCDTITPVDLMQVILRAEVELIYFGGIGTYVKAAQESHEAVADRANDMIRVDGKDIRAKVVGEGANLGFTQNGRIEYAMNGGRLNTDAIDNSAGVDTSDHEVNIKILLSQAVKSGALPIPARNKLLATMTDEVATLVLRDNYRQSLALSIAQSRAVELLPSHILTIRLLEKIGLLNRKVEFLPSDEELAERQRANKGLTRPELAVLLSYSKIWLYEELMKSSVPDDDFLHDNLLNYFPEALQKKFADAIDKHQLRREIVATYLTNSLINRMGSHFIPTIMQQTGKSAVDVARTYMLVRAAFCLPNFWQKIKALDGEISGQSQLMMLHSINRMVAHVVAWFLTEVSLPAKLNPTIEVYRTNITYLMTWLTKQAPAGVTEAWRSTMDTYVKQGIPAPLAESVAKIPYIASTPNLVFLAEKADCSIERLADIYFGLSHRLNIDWLRDKAISFQAITSWQREAVQTLIDDLLGTQRRLVTQIVGKPNRKDGKKTFREGTGVTQVAAWLEKNNAKLEAYDALIIEIKKIGTLDVSILTLAHRELRSLAG